MRILPHLLLVDLLILGRRLNISGQFPQILAGSEASDVHPAFIIDIFKQLRDEIVVFLIDSEFLTILLAVETHHHPVQEAHNQVVVVTALSVSEHHCTLLKQIVLEGFSVVNWLHTFIDCLVHVR